MILLAALILLFADGVPDGFPPWGGLLLQTGAFGLLVYIVVVFGPRMLRETREERETRDVAFGKLIDKLTEKQDERHRELIAELKTQNTAITLAMDKITMRVDTAVTTICRHEP